MASTTVTIVPIHADNLALVQDFQNQIGEEFEQNQAGERFEGRRETDMLKYPSSYAPMDDMTYTNHVIYSVLGHSASGIPLPMGGEPASTGKFITAYEVPLDVIDIKGSYEIIGNKLNGTRKALPTDTSLAYGIPPFPSVQLGPEDLHAVSIWSADTDLLKFPACTSDAMTQMFDFRIAPNGQVQMLIHPTEVIYRTRELFRKPIKSDDAGVQAEILTELRQLYVCALAMTLALQDEDYECQRSRTLHFRKGMRQNYVTTTSLDKDAIKKIAPPSRVRMDAEAPDGKGTATDLWFIRALLIDWATMTTRLLYTARKELGENDSNVCSWY